ncbi:Probable carboxylesterase 18 [Linum perenne]
MLSPQVINNNTSKEYEDIKSSTSTVKGSKYQSTHTIPIKLRHHLKAIKTLGFVACVAASCVVNVPSATPPSDLLCHHTSFRPHSTISPTPRHNNFSSSSSSRRHDGTVNHRLLNFLDLKSPSSTPIQSIVSSDVTVDASRNLWFRLYTPIVAASTSATLLIFLFFHDRGFAFLSPASVGYDLVYRRFARNLPAIVVSVNYCRFAADEMS